MAHRAPILPSGGRAIRRASVLRALPRSHSCLDADCRSASPRPSKLVVLLLTTAFLPSTRLWVKMREARR